MLHLHPPRQILRLPEGRLRMTVIYFTLFHFLIPGVGRLPARKRGPGAGAVREPPLHNPGKNNP
jgi:hypothetical protein